MTYAVQTAYEKTKNCNLAKDAKGYYEDRKTNAKTWWNKRPVGSGNGLKTRYTTKVTDAGQHQEQFLGPHTCKNQVKDYAGNPIRRSEYLSVKNGNCKLANIINVSDETDLAEDAIIVGAAFEIGDTRTRPFASESDRGPFEFFVRKEKRPTGFEVRSPNGIKVVITTNNVRAHLFKYCKGIRAVEFTQPETRIGAYAFAFCEDLKTIINPENIIAIGNAAFAKCALQDETLDERREREPLAMVNARQIGAYAFFDGVEDGIRLPQNAVATGDDGAGAELRDEMGKPNLQYDASNLAAAATGLTKLFGPNSVRDNGFFISGGPYIEDWDQKDHIRRYCAPKTRSETIGIMHTTMSLGERIPYTPRPAKDARFVADQLGVGRIFDAEYFRPLTVFQPDEVVVDVQQRNAVANAPAFAAQENELKRRADGGEVQRPLDWQVRANEARRNNKRYKTSCKK